MFLETFDRTQPLEQQVRLPFTLDKKESIKIILDGEPESYALQRGMKEVPISPMSARYGVVIKKAGYLSTSELWQAMHSDETEPYTVRYQIRDLRNAVAELTDEEIIKTRFRVRPLFATEGEISDLIGGGYYMGRLALLRNEPGNVLSWNGFQLNGFTGYLKTPNGRGFDDIEYRSVKLLWALMQRRGGIVSTEEIPNDAPTLVKKLRKIIGKEYIQTEYKLGYYLANPTQSHPQRAYASQSLIAPGRSS